MSSFLCVTELAAFPLIKCKGMRIECKHLGYILTAPEEPEIDKHAAKDTE